MGACAVPFKRSVPVFATCAVLVYCLLNDLFAPCQYGACAVPFKRSVPVFATGAVLVYCLLNDPFAPCQYGACAVPFKRSVRFFQPAPPFGKQRTAEASPSPHSEEAIRSYHLNH
jgi:hypothetical protein